MATVNDWMIKDEIGISAGLEINAGVRENFKDHPDGGHVCKLCGDRVAHPRAAAAHLAVHHRKALEAGGPGSGRRPYGGQGKRKSGMITKRYAYVSPEVAQAAGFASSNAPGLRYEHPEGHTIADISDYSPKGHGFQGNRVTATKEMHDKLKTMNKLERQNVGYYSPPGKGWSEIHMKQ